MSHPSSALFASPKAPCLRLRRHRRQHHSAVRCIWLPVIDLVSCSALNCRPLCFRVGLYIDTLWDSVHSGLIHTSPCTAAAFWISDNRKLTEILYNSLKCICSKIRRGSRLGPGVARPSFLSALPQFWLLKIMIVLQWFPRARFVLSSAMQVVLELIIITVITLKLYSALKKKNPKCAALRCVC